MIHHTYNTVHDTLYTKIRLSHQTMYKSATHPSDEHAHCTVYKKLLDLPITKKKYRTV